MVSVSYRKVGDKWYIRFRERGGKEVTKRYPGTLHEKTIARKCNWYKEEISLDRYDPWEDEGRITVDDALQEYLHVNIQNGNWAQSTYKTNVSVLNRMMEPIAGKRLGKETPQHVFQQVYEELPGEAFTKRSDRGRVNGFLTYVVDEGYVPKKYKVSLPMKYVIEIRNTDSVKYITWQQLSDICSAHEFITRQNKALFKNPNTRPAKFYTDIWWFMFYSLLRKEEVPKLKVKDLRGSRLKVQGKGRRVDTITLPPPALKIAQEFAKGKKANDPLFVPHMNRSKVHFGKAVAMALGEDHHSKGFHQLRHAGVVHYITLGKPIQFISKLARHRSAQVTLTVYSDVIPDGMEQAFSDIEHGPATE